MMMEILWAARAAPYIHPGLCLVTGSKFKGARSSKSNMMCFLASSTYSQHFWSFSVFWAGTHKTQTWPHPKSSPRSSKNPDIYLFFPSDDRYHCGRDVCQFTKIESGLEMKSWYTCGYWFIQISVFRYIGNIGVFHKDPVCSFHFRLEAVLARMEVEEGMKFTRRTWQPVTFLLKVQ